MGGAADKTRTSENEYDWWKQSQEYGNISQVCSHGAGKAKAHLQSRLESNVKDSKKGLHRLLSSWRKMKEKWFHCWIRQMIWWDMIWKMPSSYISLIVRVAFRNPRFLEGLEQGRLTLWRWASDEWTLKATEHKQACGKLWHALTSFERTCWRHCQVILDYHEKVLSECRGSWGLWERERRVNQSSSQPNLDPRKGDGANPSEIHFKKMKDRNMIRSRQHWFTKKSFFTCLISQDEKTCQWSREEQQRFILTLAEFSMLSHYSLIDKLRNGLDKWEMKWVEK